MKKIDLKVSKEKMANAMDEIGKVAKKTIDELPVVAQEGAKFVSEQYDKAKLDFDKKVLRPVFIEDVLDDSFKKPLLLKIVDYDKRMNNEACQGAIGFQENIKSEDVLSLYSENAKDTNFKFHPFVMETIYYLNPYDNSMYIALDEYFSYIKTEKVNELEMIANKLGAKSVKISFKEMKTTLVSQEHKAKLKVNGNKAETNHMHKSNEYVNMKVESEIKFEGSDNPEKPILKYFTYENNILNLIDMRLNNRIKSKSYEFDYSTSRDMQEKTAASIDSVLKKLGLSGNGSVQSEVQSQKRIVLEYSIEFQ